MLRTTQLARLALAVLVCAGCASAAALEMGSKAPPLAVSKWVKGEPVDLAAGARGKVVVVEFWATWCGPCIQSIPHLTEMQHQFGEDVIVIGMTTHDPSNSLAKVEEFVTSWGERMDYTVAFDDGSKTSDAYMRAAEQEGIPTSFVIDAEGVVVWIGHPMDGLDRVVADVLTGSYDVESARKLATVEAKLQNAARSGDAEGLLAAARDITELAPGRAQSWGQLMAIQQALRSEDDERLASLDAAGQALAAHPAQLSEFIVEMIGGSDFVATHIRRLQAPLQGALERTPDDLDLLRAAAVVELATGDAAAAAKSVERVLAGLQGKDMELQGLGRVLGDTASGLEDAEQRSAGLDLALRVLEAAAAAAPAEPSHLLSQFYVLAVYKGDTDAAAAVGSRAVAATASDLDTLNGFCWSLLTDESYAGSYSALALEAAEAMARLPGASGWSYADTIALAYFENGKIAEAIELEKQAIADCPDPRAVFELRERLERFEAAPQGDGK